MTYSIACGDVMPGCAARFESDDEDDLLGQVTEHAQADHGISEVTPEVASAVKAAIKTA